MNFSPTYVHIEKRRNLLPLKNSSPQILVLQNLSDGFSLYFLSLHAGNSLLGLGFKGSICPLIYSLKNIGPQLWFVS
jgi:hypothetical protein